MTIYFEGNCYKEDRERETTLDERDEDYRSRCLLKAAKYNMVEKQQEKCDIGDPVEVSSREYRIGDTVRYKWNDDHVKIRIEWYLTLFTTIPASGELMSRCWMNKPGHSISRIQK